ncbi:hypothetical protein PAXRUDRAFT_162865 [Paxillus rubicundulus Ve08.2h10]|uniref:HTH CENPB-type domain-containing protein n=1 Tax=Paxillus rubicundulus Ve08.2h10 TaxID=930991 RepID=A0A0D0DKV1_9AGAM|nr:hypothetical protein PAXRUDRAFT_162865 [Paxillus rubicundulus Ve08.2h10]
MVGQAKSQLRKKHSTSTHQEGVIANAVDQYNKNKEKSKGERKSLRAICQEVQEEWRALDSKHHACYHLTTVIQRLQGGRSCQQANSKNHAWLTLEEEENVVAYLLDLAAQGFPLTQKTLKLHIKALLQAWLGDAFPETGVGYNWTDCFAYCHAEHITQYWSFPLDTAHGQAVNPNTHKAWCDLLKETLERENIEEDCI